VSEPQQHLVALRVNGRAHRAVVESRTTLVELLRDHLGLTGTHVGCEQGACGACTVIVEGTATRACLMFAVQADDRDVRTVEGLASGGELGALQLAFSEHHALQCGFCTAGFLMTATSAFDDGDILTDPVAVRTRLSGNLCRCTGYTPIVEAVVEVARRRQDRTPG